MESSQQVVIHICHTRRPDAPQGILNGIGVEDRAPPTQEGDERDQLSGPAFLELD